MNSILFIRIDGELNRKLFEKLRSEGIGIVEKHSVAEAEDHLHVEQLPLCVVRCSEATKEVLKAVAYLRQHFPSMKVILSVQKGTVEEAVDAMKRGISDFLIGTSTSPRVIESITNCIPSGEPGGGYPGRPESEGVGSDADAVLVGQSSAICEIRSAVNLVAKSQTPVLITGESGTGKEVVVRLIHQQSNRSHKQFVALNCASLPKDVIENELFGHEKGAFTGALTKKAGCFELANGGTLLFDEIAEMSPETQAKLLRAIETQKFRRLGGKEEVRVDVRMIAATNKNISAALKSKELREDLYYRLSVIEIFIPPLRERKEDIPLLVDHFLSLFAVKYGKPRQQFTEESLTMLCSYDWPGNVREIRNVVERALVICPHDEISPQYLPERIHRQAPSQNAITISIGISAREAERMLILRTLASTGNNKAKTAKILGMSRKTLHNKLQSFGQK